MRDLLDDDLAELYPVRQSEEDLRLAGMRQRLFAEPARRRIPAWAGVAAAAAAVLMIAGLVVFVRPSHDNAPVATMPTKPVTSLVEAAGLLEVTAEPRGKYRHIRYMTWMIASMGLLEVEGIDPQWGATRFEYQTDVYLPAAKGQNPVVHERYTGNHQPAGGVQRPDELLTRLQAPELWTTLCTHTPCHEVTLLMPLSADPATKLRTAATTLTSPFTTNQEKAALYRQLAADPAVRWDNGTVSMEGGATTFRVDPTTGEVAGYEDRHPYPQSARSLPPGTVTLDTTITYEWTDQRPS